MQGFGFEADLVQQTEVMKLRVYEIKDSGETLGDKLNAIIKCLEEYSLFYHKVQILNLLETTLKNTKTYPHRFAK